MKTCDLTGYELDYYTGIALWKKIIVSHKHRFCLLDGDIETHEKSWNPSTNWAITGRLIEENKIGISYCGPLTKMWLAHGDYDGIGSDGMLGSDALIATCRYIVHSIIGDEVPEIEGAPC